MPKQSKESSESSVKTVAITADSHKRAQVACSITGRKLVHFLSEASDKLSDPILRKNGFDPETAKPIATAA